MTSITAGVRLFFQCEIIKSILIERFKLRQHRSSEMNQWRSAVRGRPARTGSPSRLQSPQVCHHACCSHLPSFGCVSSFRVRSRCSECLRAAQWTIGVGAGRGTNGERKATSQHATGDRHEGRAVDTDRRRDPCLRLHRPCAIVGRHRTVQTRTGSAARGTVLGGPLGDRRTPITADQSSSRVSTSCSYPD
jgi:hypothetical protein